MERVYEMGRIFRNEGMDATHNPEFTSIEAYSAYENWENVMEMCEGMFKYLAKKLNIQSATSAYYLACNITTHFTC